MEWGEGGGEREGNHLDTKKISVAHEKKGNVRMVFFTGRYALSATASRMKKKTDTRNNRRHCSKMN